jgi:hypothetical protein
MATHVPNPKWGLYGPSQSLTQSSENGGTAGHLKDVSNNHVINISYLQQDNRLKAKNFFTSFVGRVKAKNDPPIKFLFLQCKTGKNVIWA